MDQDSGLPEDQITLVCRRLELGKPAAVRQAGGTRNLTFIADMLSERWVLRRRYAGYCQPARIAFDHSAARWLAERAVPVVPPRRTPAGDTFLRVDGEVWEAYPLVEGRHLRDGNAADCAVLGQSLARFHEAGASFTGRYSKLGPRGETDPGHLLESGEKAAADAPDCRPVLEVYRQAVVDAAAELTDERYIALPHTLVHGDVQPANILMLPDENAGATPEVRAFLDLDWVARRPRIYDLAFAILCCCAAHQRPLGGGDVWAISQMPVLHPEPVRAFLGSYQPLTDAERTALVPQLMLSWCHIRVDNSLKLPPAERRAFLDRPPADQRELAAALRQVTQ